MRTNVAAARAADVDMRAACHQNANREGTDQIGSGSDGQQFKVHNALVASKSPSPVAYPASAQNPSGDEAQHEHAEPHAQQDHRLAESRRGFLQRRQRPFLKACQALEAAIDLGKCFNRPDRWLPTGGLRGRSLLQEFQTLAHRFDRLEHLPPVDWCRGGWLRGRGRERRKVWIAHRKESQRSQSRQKKEFAHRARVLSLAWVSAKRGRIRCRVAPSALESG